MCNGSIFGLDVLGTAQHPVNGNTSALEARKSSIDRQMIAYAELLNTSSDFRLREEQNSAQ